MDRCLFLCFPSFQLCREGDREDSGRGGAGHTGGPEVGDQTLVGSTDLTEPSVDRIQTEEEQPVCGRVPRQSSFAKQMPLGGLPVFGKALLTKGFDKATVKLIMDAWRPSTKKLYSTYIRKWVTFCTEREIEVLRPSLPQACRFLRILSTSGLGYAALNSARCALSTILPDFGGYSFGKHPLVCWLVKGGYERNPPKPRYSHFWDVNLVFELLKRWGRNDLLSLKKLSFKLAILLLLVSSQRGQTIVNLSVDDMTLEEVITFRMKRLLKHNRLGDPLASLVFRPFLECKRLCVVRMIKRYMEVTKPLRKHNKLLLSFLKPHRPISRDTLSRWTLLVMKEAGVDTVKYRGHSMRGASASAAKRLGVPLNLILKQASWKSADSFARFYDKDLDVDPTEVGVALLRDSV